MYEDLFAQGGLTFDRLRALVEVADAGGITQAVAGDSNRQTLYSRHLKTLSEFFGCELTRRNGRSIVLTPRGEELLQIARLCLTSLNDFHASCRSREIDYTIACGDSLIQWLVLPQLARRQSLLSDCRFAVENLRTRDVVREIQDGHAHFGIIRTNAVPDDISSGLLGKMEFSLAVPRRVGETAAPSFSNALSSFALVGQSSDGQFVRKLETVFESLGFSLRPKMLCQSFPQILEAVHSGNFAGVVPSLSQGTDEERCWYLDHEAFRSLDRELALIWTTRTEEIRPDFRRLKDLLLNAFQIDSV